VLFAGLHGLREELPLPDPVKGDAYTQEAGGSVPLSLDGALDALEADEYILDAIGDAIVTPFLAIKRFEIERHRSWVSDWERDEYLHHL
jgi:glutamine synthetase